jgi:hypothetical protein
VLNGAKTIAQQQYKMTEFEVSSVQGGYTKNVHFMQTNALTAEGKQ